MTKTTYEYLYSPDGITTFVDFGGTVIGSLVKIPYQVTDIGNFKWHHVAFSGGEQLKGTFDSIFDGAEALLDFVTTPQGGVQ